MRKKPDGIGCAEIARQLPPFRIERLAEQSQHGQVDTRGEIQ
jgi:hypothetical protein